MELPAEPDLARAMAFLARGDFAGTRREPWRWGTAVFMPECPLRHDGNHLRVESPPPGVDAAALAAEADRVQGGAGLAHRCLFFPDTAAAESLAPGFAALGFEVHRGVVMARRRAAEAVAPAVPVVETTPDALRAAREAQYRTYPWATAEVARQLVAARALLPLRSRDHAVFVDGEPVAWIETYLDGDVAQLEALATVERFRGRGFAKALLARAAEDAVREGARLVFLVADAADWPRRLYARLGYDVLGGHAKFTRAPGSGSR